MRKITIPHSPSTTIHGGCAAAFACALVAGMLLLAGCAKTPDTDPIFQVVPPAQQTPCPSGAASCTPTQPKGQTGSGY